MNQNWHYIFPKKSLLRAYNVSHFKALIVNNKNKLQQQNENKLNMCINRYTVYHCITFYVYITHTTDKFRVR